MNEITIKFSMSQYLFERMDIFNQKFDEGIENGNDPKVEMERVVTSIFKVAAQVVESFAEGLSDELKAQSTKVIAKVMVDTITAGAIYPALGEVANGYLEEIVGRYNEIVAEFKNVEVKEGETNEVEVIQSEGRSVFRLAATCDRFAVFPEPLR